MPVQSSSLSEILDHYIAESYEDCGLDSDSSHISHHSISPVLTDTYPIYG